MAQIIDLDEVAQSVAPTLESYKTNSTKPGQDGVLARLGVDIDLALTLWRCKESNRGTDPNDIIEAMLTALTAHVVGELIQHVKDPGDRTLSAMNIGGGFIQKMIAGCGAIQSGECQTNFVASKEVGTA